MSLKKQPIGPVPETTAEVAYCPQGKPSMTWFESQDHTDNIKVTVRFSKTDCQACDAQSRCTRSNSQGRNLRLHPRAQFDALQMAKKRFDSEEGKQLYAQRAGIEGALSQGVRAFGLRCSRCYRGLAKTHLQQVITAVTINLDRLAAWFDGRPQEKMRVSRFADSIVYLLVPISPTSNQFSKLSLKIFASTRSLSKLIISTSAGLRPL